MNQLSQPFDLLIICYTTQRERDPFPVKPRASCKRLWHMSFRKLTSEFPLNDQSDFASERTHLVIAIEKSEIDKHRLGNLLNGMLYIFTGFVSRFGINFTDKWSKLLNHFQLNDDK